MFAAAELSTSTWERKETLEMEATGAPTIIEEENMELFEDTSLSLGV